MPAGTRQLWEIKGKLKAKKRFIDAGGKIHDFLNLVRCSLMAGKGRCTRYLTLDYLGTKIVPRLTILDQDSPSRFDYSSSSVERAIAVM